jgi:flavin reductase (DIM6/NTAB) family NADH-FMN oxidoreductase RutF
MDGTGPMTGGMFDPSAHPRRFRDALGQFATGVTLVTTLGPDGPVGMVANSFAAVSLDPPLILWSPARSSGRFALFAEAETFAVHVLAADQRALADGFAASRSGPTGIAWDRVDAIPVVPGTLARFICTAHARHDGGDHLIIVGRVQQAEVHPGAPLVFQGGAWGRFQPD